MIKMSVGSAGYAKNICRNLTGEKILPGSLSNREFCYININILTVQIQVSPLFCPPSVYNIQTISVLCIHNEMKVTGVSYIVLLFKAIIPFGNKTFKMIMHQTFMTGILILVFFAWYWQIIWLERCPSNQVIYMHLWIENEPHHRAVSAFVCSFADSDGCLFCLMATEGARANIFTSFRSTS